MTERKFLSFAVFGAILAVICYGRELNSSEEEAKIFLNQTSDEVNSFYDGVANKIFADTYDPDYDQDEINRNYSKFWQRVANDARKFDFKNFKDNDLKYAFEMLLKKPREMIIGEEQLSELYNSLHKLESLLRENLIEDYHNSSIELAYSTDIEKITKDSNDSSELEYYWIEWRKITSEWAEENFNITIDALKEAARLHDVSPLEYWLRGFNITDMENLMTEIQPFYMELHAFLRNLLQKKYGDSVITSDGLIPDQFFDQFLKQNDSIIKGSFPAGSLPPVESILIGKFNATQIHEIADNFYEKLGFEKYPSNIWGKRIRMFQPENSDDYHCTPQVWTLSPGIHLEYCEKFELSDFLEVYAYMSYIYYAKEMAGLPAHFFDYPNDLFKAVGRAIFLSASTHHNLKTLGLIIDFNITEEVEINRLLRQAMENLVIIPINFVNAKVLADFLSGNVKMSELNHHYWQLMKKYAGIKPPNGYEPQRFDLSHFFFSDMIDNQMSSDFTNEVLGYQIYKKLCEVSGKYPNEPLHLCDISGSKKAGTALKNMMQLGVSKPFYKVLATMFPENPTVRAEALLEYYNPIKMLLVEKNKEANVKPGWKTSDVNQ